MAAAVYDRSAQRRSRTSRSGLVWYLIAGVAIGAVFVVPLLWEVFRSLPAGIRGQQPAVRGELHPPDVR